MSKRQSGDDFSPPAPIDKHPVLSPIKSPQAVVKSPAKRSYSRKSTVDKLPTSANTVSDSIKFGNTYDQLKSRDRKTSQSKASPSLSDCDKSVSRRVARPRKNKQKFKSQVYVSQDYDTESETENLSHSSDSVRISPHKSVSPQKSLNASSRSGKIVCSNKPVTSSAKRKDKLIREKDSVKLKPDCSTIVPEKLTNCDSSKAASKVSHLSCADSLPVDQMLVSFTPGEKPLSPIPNLSPIDNKCRTDENLRKAGLAVSTVKPASLNRKPTVLVKIDLNLLYDFLCLDKNNPNFLKPLPHTSDLLRPNVTGAKSFSPSVNKNRKSPRVNESDSQVSKSVPSKTSPFNNVVISNDKSSLSAKQSSFVKSNNKATSELQKAASVRSKKDSESDIPDFDLLPVKEPTVPEESNLSDGSDDSDSGSSGSSSSSSDSESENEDTKAASVSPAHEFDDAASRHSTDTDIKKRKLQDSRPDDSKRRKTLDTFSTQKSLANEITHR